MKFPVPHDVKAKAIPGTEGWERMYPYQYQFVTDDPVRNQYEKETFWFYDGLHYPEPLYPFDTIWDEAWFLALSQFNNRIFQVPPVRGVDHRMINGYVYISPVPVKDGAEIGSRVPNFMERAGYYYKNWDQLEAKWKTKMEATIKELEDLKISPLPDLEDISVVTDAIGESKGYHLIKNYDDLINLGIKCWQYHFEFLNLGYAAYVFFMDFTQKLFPSIPLQRITQMISGIDVIMYKPDDELKELAKKAVALGVDAAVVGNRDWVAVKLAVEKLPKGAEWLAAFEKARYPWFNISTGTGWFHHRPFSWNDTHGHSAVNGIQTYIGKIKAGVSIDRPDREQVRAERDRITAEYRAHDRPGRSRLASSSTNCWAAPRPCSPTSRTTCSTSSTGSTRCSGTRCAKWRRFIEGPRHDQRRRRHLATCAATRSSRRCGTSSPPGPPASSRAARFTWPTGNRVAQGRHGEVQASGARRPPSASRRK
jgi:pyruvate,water dikinase